jgi:hypothetical protein
MHGSAAGCTCSACLHLQQLLMQWMQPQVAQQVVLQVLAAG